MDAVILGGGLSGLVCALELQRRGVSVSIVEQAAIPGGLARTLEHEGHRFDLGGHRFHSNNPDVVAWLEYLLPDDLLVVQRQSRIRLAGDFVDYPLQLPGALSAFPLHHSFRMATSYLAARATNGPGADVTFEDWVVRRFGRALYEAFFRPYTEKVWGLPCHEISADWASQRIGLPSLGRALRQVLLPREERLPTSATEFLYPRRGFGMIADAVVAELVSGGARLLTSTRPLAIRSGSSEVEVDVARPTGVTETLRGEWLISTIPPSALVPLLRGDDPTDGRSVGTGALEYRDLICLFVEIDRPRVSTDHWTYFPDRSLLFGRTHEPKNWSSEMVSREDRTSLVIEVFASRGDEVWRLDDGTLAQRCAAQLAAIGFIPEGSVIGSRVIRVPFAYPLYRVHYRETIAAFHAITAKVPRLCLAGRTGTFRYMNSDGVIENAFEVVDAIAPAPLRVRGLAVQEQRWA